VARTPADVLASKAGDAPPPAPKAGAKWVTASVVQNAATVIAAVFDEVQRRDPSHTPRWVAVVDGNNHQIHRMPAEAETRGVDVAIVVDLIHVLEYLWAECGASSMKETPPPKLGYTTGPWPCWTARPPRSPQASDAEPPWHD